MNRNIVCEILMKDNDGVAHSLFIIEGDKPADSSLYVVKNRHINTEDNQTKEEIRELALQMSYHSRTNPNGLVRTHIKGSNGEYFGEKNQAPLSKRTKPLYAFHLNADKIERYPVKKPATEDIILSLIPERISDCTFVFYTKKQGLNAYLQSHDQILVNSYPLPLRYTPDVSLAVTIATERLKEIQSK